MLVMFRVLRGWNATRVFPLHKSKEEGSENNMEKVESKREEEEEESAKADSDSRFLWVYSI
jgi:hypothetical protein